MKVMSIWKTLGFSCFFGNKAKDVAVQDNNENARKMMQEKLAEFYADMSLKVELAKPNYSLEMLNEKTVIFRISSLRGQNPLFAQAVSGTGTSQDRWTAYRMEGNDDGTVNLKVTNSEAPNYSTEEIGLDVDTATIELKEVIMRRGLVK